MANKTFKRVIAAAAAAAVAAPVAVSAAALDTTTYTGEQKYQGFKTDYKFLDTFDTYYAVEGFGHVPIYGYNSTRPGTTGTPVTGGLGKAADDNYLKLTIGDEAAQSAEIAYGGGNVFDFSGTTKDMYFTIEFYNPSEGGGQVEFRPCFGSYDAYNYFNKDGTIKYSEGNDLFGEYELDKWNTVTMRVSNGDGSTNKYTMEMYLNGEYVCRRAFAKNADMTRGSGQFRFTVATKNSTAYFDNAGIGLVSDDKTTGSYVEVPVIDESGKFDVDGKTINYKIGATLDGLLESVTNIDEFGDGENIALLNADGDDITSEAETIEDVAAIQFKNGEFTRTYALQEVISPDDKTWLNVDFDDDKTEVLSSVDDSEIRNGFLTAIKNNNSIGTVTSNNQLAVDEDNQRVAGAMGAEVVSGAPGRAEGDKSLMLTIPQRAKNATCQLNFEWSNEYNVISTSTSGIAVEFSAMIPKASSGAKISPMMFYNADEAGATKDPGKRKWGISQTAINNNAVTIGEKQANNTIDNKWTKVTYNFTKFADVADGAVVADSGECDIYVDGVKYATIKHSMPNLAALQFKLEAQDLPDKYEGETKYSTIYIDDIKIYTFKEKTPYFLNSKSIAPVYGNVAEGYEIDDENKVINADSSFAGIDAAAAVKLIGAQAILNANLTAKGAEDKTAFTDVATYKSAGGNIIYYYKLKEYKVDVAAAEITAEGSAYHYTTTITNNTKEAVNGAAVIVGYDSEGLLMQGMDLQKIENLTSGSELTLDITGNFENPSRVCVFIWDVNQKSICNVINYTAPEDTVTEE